MNAIAKVIVTTTLAFAAFSAQAEDLTYPGPAPKSAGSAAVASGQESPHIFRGEFLVDNPKYKAPAGRSVDQVRQEIIKANRRIDATNVNA